MYSVVVLNCGSEYTTPHNLLEHRFFICLCRFGENVADEINGSEFMGNKREFMYDGSSDANDE